MMLCGFFVLFLLGQSGFLVVGCFFSLLN